VNGRTALGIAVGRRAA